MERDSCNKRIIFESDALIILGYGVDLIINFP